MTHDTGARRGHSSRSAHLGLGLLLLSVGAAMTLWPAARAAGWVIGAASVMTHVGLALSALLGLRLLKQAHSGEINPLSRGRTIRWAALYDVLVPALCFGRERVLREAMLDRAAVSPGDRVLDVGCGTGTLAIAATRRVGAAGAVCGVDAAPEMVARAKRKAMIEGLEARFDVAPAQALPFPENAFDVVLCTLMLHHLPAEGRSQALAEIRRVLRPGGRLLIVDLRSAKGMWAALNPIRLVHGHDAMHVVEEVPGLMKAAGFSDIITGKLSSRVLGYVVGKANE